MALRLFHSIPPILAYFDSMARSLPPLGSLALEVTETRNVMIGPTVPAGTVYGTLIVAVAPTVSVPKLQDRTEDAPTAHDPCEFNDSL